MRLAWFTPLSAGNGIARYSSTVLGALPAGVEVEVWAPPCDEALDAGGRAVRWIGDPDEAARATEATDLRVFNIGNHPAFAAGIFGVYERTAGLVILHDKVMQDFFYAVRSPGDYYRLMTYFYGQSGSDGAVRALADGATLSDAAFTTAFPLLEACLHRADGVLTHSAHSAEMARARYGDLVPVRSAQLPAFTYDRGSDGALATREELEVPAGRVLILATGRVARTKQLHTIVDAIAGCDELRARCLFVSVGEAEADYLASLTSRIEAAGLGGAVRLVTRADDRTLHSYLAAADVCVNLRHPSTEASSATLVEQLDAGKPVIVYDTGVYGELPDGVAIKVAVESGATGVAGALLGLLDDADAAAELGRRAGDYAREHCDPVMFAERLVEFAAEVIENRPALRRLESRATSLGSPRDLASLRAAAAAAVSGEA